MRHYAVLIDLSALRIGANIFRRIYNDLTATDSVEYIKFYNYNTKRHRELRTVVSEYNIDVDLSQSAKSRVRVDIREVIDAIRIASSIDAIDSFFIVCGEVDGLYLFDALRRMGKYITMGVTSPTTLSGRAHAVYLIDRMDEVADEVAISSMEIEQLSRVKGARDSISPYSDVESNVASDKMSIIDDKILEVIDRKSPSVSKNLTQIFGKTN